MKELFREDLISYNLSKRIPSLKRYVEDTQGKIVDSIWNDIPQILSSKEKTGYASQKTVQLLRRVIQIASNSSDTILDPFCGSGTSLVAAQLENRSWIGCDISDEAVDISLGRMKTLGISKSQIDCGSEKEIKERYDEFHPLPNVQVLA